MAEPEIWDVESYDKSNGAQARDAEELYKKIVEKKIKSADIIVEIGCGSGNITEGILAKRIKHKKIYSSDISEDMVQYANNNHNDGTIEYFVQDIGLPWEKLDARLRNLEGKVDLLWSNRVIHWLSPELRENCIKTIVRLLKPGGSFFINISQRRDINEFLSKEEKLANLKLLKFESHEEQQNAWKNLFNNAGLSQLSFEFLAKSWKFDTVKEYEQQFQAVTMEGFLRSIVTETVKEEEKDAIAKRFLPWIIKQFNTKYGQDFQVHADPDVRNIYNEMYQVVGTK